MSNERHHDPKNTLQDIKQVAERLNVSERAFSRLVASGKAPTPVRIGRCVRWDGKEIEQWIADGCPKRDRR